MWKPSSNTTSKRAVHRRARQTKTPKSSSAILRQSVTDARPLHVLVDNPSTYLSSADQTFPRNGTLSNQVYNIVQAFEVQNVHTTSITTPTFSQQAYSLSQLDQVSSLITLFDQYRIVMVEARYVPVSFNSGSTVTTTNFSGGLITSVVDYNDAAMLTSVGQALDYQNELTAPCGSSFTRTFKPHLSVGAYTGTAFTGYSNDSDQWIDTVSSTVQHYGLKLASTSTGTSITYSSISRIWIQFRNVR